MDFVARLLVLDRILRITIDPNMAEWGLCKYIGENFKVFQMIDELDVFRRGIRVNKSKILHDLKFEWKLSSKNL